MRNPTSEAGSPAAPATAYESGSILSQLTPELDRTSGDLTGPGCIYPLARSGAFALVFYKEPAGVEEFARVRITVDLHRSVGLTPASPVVHR
jgi:hypothetical protein